MPSPRLRLLQAAGRLLPPVAVAVFVGSTSLWVALSLRAGGFAFDYLAYDAAARRLLAGLSLYDTSYQAAGQFGLFFYPPPFAFLVVPFVLLPAGLGPWTWTAVVTGATLAAVAIMPVRTWVRWLTLGLAGLSWPVVFAIELGQVGPLLLLLFAAGWRWLASDAALGAAASLGALIKVQPVLLFGWLLCRRRWRAAAVGVGLGLAISLAATLVVSPAAWLDLVGLVSRVADPITAPANVTVGAVAYQLGLGRSDAVVVHWLGVGLVMLAWLAAAIRRPPVVGYLATVVVSQLVSPLLWDHYAMLLLLPVAYLVDRGWSWAALVPLATPWLLAGHIPAVIYPLSYALVLGALLVVPEPAAAHVHAAGTAVAAAARPRPEGPDAVPSTR